MRSKSLLAALVIAVFALVGALAGTWPNQKCTPAVAGTPQCNGGCTQTFTFQNAAHTLCNFTCSNNNCPGGTTTQTANPGTCNESQETTCTGPLYINIQVDCGACSCPVGTTNGVACNSPPQCGCTWAETDPPPMGCPQWINNVVTCSTP